MHYSVFFYIEIVSFFESLEEHEVVMACLIIVFVFLYVCLIVIYEKQCQSDFIT